MLKFNSWMKLLLVVLVGLTLLPFAVASADSGDLGPSFHLGANPVYGPAPEYQINAAVAFGATDYLVVWSDPRTGASSDVYGARVSTGGATLDPAGIAITTTSPTQQDPAVASDGTNFLVVWIDARNGIPNDIYGARVNQEGAVLDPAGLPISVTPEAQAEVAIAFADSTYLVVWTDARNGVANIYGARVTPRGAVLDTAGIALCLDPAGQSSPAVASDGESWLVVWEDNRNGTPDIYGTRVGADGAVLDPAGIVISSATGDQVYPTVASSGSGYLVVWDDKRGGTSRDIYAARLDAAGAVLDSAGVAVSVLAGDEEYPAVTFDGTNYLAVWDDLRNGGTWDLYAARLDITGAVLDPAGFPVTTYASQEFAPAVASCGDNALVTWHDSRNGPKDIYGMRVAPDGSVLDSGQILISMGAAYQAYPAVATNGSVYLAAWHEWRLGTVYNIFGTRLGPDGTVLDSLGVELSAAAGDQLYPAVASNGTDWLTVWQDGRSGTADVYGTRISAGGARLDASGLAISTATGVQEYPAAASDGSGYVVVWQDKRSGGYDIYASRVASDGTVRDPAGIAVSTAPGDQAHPALAYDGTNYVVVWQDSRGGTADIYGARLAADGTVLDAAGFAVSTAAGAQEWPAIAFDGTNYLAVWQDKRGGPYADIYGARIATGGTVVDAAGIAISTAANEQLAPSLGFDGWKYLVAWQDKRSAATSPDIYGAKIDKAGTVIDPTGLQIAKIANTQLAPAVAVAPSGQVLITYSSFTPPPPYGSFRIWANFYDSRAGVADGDDGEGNNPRLARLFVPSPNPFGGSTTLRFYLAETQQVSLGVYDVRGRLVRSLVNAVRAPGAHEVAWDGLDAGNRLVSPGVYFLRLRTGRVSLAQRLVLAR